MACFQAPGRTDCSGSPGPAARQRLRPGPSARLPRGWARCRTPSFSRLRPRPRARVPMARAAEAGQGLEARSFLAPVPERGAWAGACGPASGNGAFAIPLPAGRWPSQPPSRAPPPGGFFCAIAFFRSTCLPPPAVRQSCGGRPAGHSLLHRFDDHFVAPGAGEFFTFCFLRRMRCRFGGLRQMKRWRPGAVGVFGDVMVWRPAGGSATIR
ncbi:hypothetical protein DFW101_3429 [Solidesulfovibrio carbinoliphilus subsp. oakridgensis]|uniref:Uncharacterized protein n=1 Tax=Solidesulfovibrio carbinoliphilus subsp. oakridgensis TaxID=694327 RepID=G7QBT4_9BACT|nr:hypothetical protein DFW101_3429 [Solidesulfovibrio carbinoliphilus subsp. oakridgensis]